MDDGHGVRVFIDKGAVVLRTICDDRDGPIRLTVDEAHQLSKVIGDAAIALSQGNEVDDAVPNEYIEEHVLDAWGMMTFGAEADRVIRLLLAYVRRLEDEYNDAEERADDMQDNWEEDQWEIKHLRALAMKHAWDWYSCPCELTTMPMEYTAHVTIPAGVFTCSIEAPAFTKSTTMTVRPGFGEGFGVLGR